MIKMSRRLLVLWLGLVVGCGGAAPSPEPTAPTARSTAAATAQTAQTAKVAEVAVSAPTSPPVPTASPTPTPPPTVSVRLGLPRVSLGTWQIDVAEREGFFRQQGIAVERADEEYERATDGVDRGSRDVALVSTAAVVGAVKEGQDLVVVAGAVNRAAYSLIAARDVEDIAGLSGKALAVRDPTDVTAGVLLRMLDAAGLSGRRRLIAFEDAGLRVAAITNGTVGASLVDPIRAAPLQAKGFKTLVNAFESVPELQAEVFAVRRDWASQNQERLVRFLSAVVAADRWIYAPGNRQAAIDVLADTARLTVPEAALIHEQYVEKVGAIPRNGEVDEAGLRTVVDILAEIDALPPPLPDPAPMVDQSYLRRAQ